VHALRDHRLGVYAVSAAGPVVNPLGRLCLNRVSGSSVHPAIETDTDYHQAEPGISFANSGQTLGRNDLSWPVQSELLTSRLAGSRGSRYANSAKTCSATSADSAPEKRPALTRSAADNSTA